jgi:hypothetical protein
MSELSLVIPFSLDASGNIRTTYDQPTIWSNRVRLAVGTIKGERAMMPAYGTKIVNGSFDTLTSMEELIDKEIGRVFSEQLSLLTYISSEVVHDATTNTFTANVSYSLPNNLEETTQVGIMVVSDANPPYEELL